MTQQATQTKYFDLFTTGIGYLNRIREVKPGQGKPFLACEIAALRGAAGEKLYTRFDCRVSGAETQKIVRNTIPDIDEERKVLISFRISDVYPDLFTYSSGNKAGQPGVSLKGRLIKINWLKIDGEVAYRAPAAKSTETDDIPF